MPYKTKQTNKNHVQMVSSLETENDFGERKVKINFLIPQDTIEITFIANECHLRPLLLL